MPNLPKFLIYLSCILLIQFVSLTIISIIDKPVDGYLADGYIEWLSLKIRKQW